jgi:hypothetical protein
LNVVVTRRVRWLFRKQLKGTGVQVHLRAIKPKEYGITDWWRHEEGPIVFQNELIKTNYYRCTSTDRSAPTGMQNAVYAPERPQGVQYHGCCNQVANTIMKASVRREKAGMRTLSVISGCPKYPLVQF